MLRNEHTGANKKRFRGFSINGEVPWLKRMSLRLREILTQKRIRNTALYNVHITKPGAKLIRIRIYNLHGQTLRHKKMSFDMKNWMLVTKRL